MARRYPGRAVGINRDESLGAGMRLRAGDDIVDASVRGYIRDIIEKLEAP
jgi:F0F1-type ATP synthase delta subunit